MCGRCSALGLLEELVEHHIVDLAWSGTVQLDDLLVFRPVPVEGPELASRIAEQHQEVLRFRAGNLFQYLLLGIAVHRTREDTVFDGIQYDAPVRLRCWLFVQSRSCFGRNGWWGMVEKKKRRKKIVR